MLRLREHQQTFGVLRTESETKDVSFALLRCAPLAASSVLPPRKSRHSRRWRHALQQFPPTQALRRTATGSGPVTEIVGTTLGSKDFMDQNHFCWSTVAWTFPS